MVNPQYWIKKKKQTEKLFSSIISTNYIAVASSEFLKKDSSHECQFKMKMEAGCGNTCL